MKTSRGSLFRVGLFCAVGAAAWPAHGSEIRAQRDPCEADTQCNSLNESAINLSRAGQFEAALATYQKAYARRPVPWLLINIGRVQQKMGHPKEAIAAYQQYLGLPAAEKDVELATTARQYLKQAEQDLAHPRQPQVILVKEEQAPRPIWRLVLGSGLLAGGMGMLIPGAYDLAIDGKCVDAPQPPMVNCPTIWSGIAVGAPLTAVGLLSIAGGIITIALPGKTVRRQVSVKEQP